MVVRRVVTAMLAVTAALPMSGNATPAAGPPVDVEVVLPRGYAAQPNRRWPVVYLLNTVVPSCSVTCKPIMQRIAVAPFITVYERHPAPLSNYVDWADGTEHNEQRWLALVHWVDARYRTQRTRAGRAIGGISAGGYGAFTLAARHPDLFAYAGSISGAIDIRGETVENELAFVVTGSPDPTTSPTAVWGPPGGARWLAYNPRDLVTRLRGLSLYHSTANGVPCGATDNPSAIPIELFVYKMNDAFHRATESARIPAKYVQSTCGVHTYRYFPARVVEWLATLRFPKR